MQEVLEILRLLSKAIERNTVNTYQEQGSAAADVVFGILEEAEKRIEAVDHPTEKGGAEMGEWIKVSERLPKPYVSVLVYMPEEAPHPTVHEGFINRRGEWYAGGFDRLPDEVVAWSKMPAPPEAE